MKSKPVYRPLEIDRTARHHVLIAQAERSRETTGIEGIAEGALDIISVNESSGPDELAAMIGMALESAEMDTAFYVAGPEAFLWAVEGKLRAGGVSRNRIYMDLAGSASRRVYCVHCQRMNFPVTMSLHPCDQCGMMLTVRDHFSRRMGAYMGVIVNAEVPEEVPEGELTWC